MHGHVPTPDYGYDFSGIIEVPEGAQWIEVDQGGPERLRLAKGPIPEMEEKEARSTRAR
jgi:hypothetical protein